MIRLKGMTWNHPRGHDPLVACAADWKAETGVEVQWDARSLQDFESYPVEELARAYDLIVIDHPHVGQITAEGCLVPLPDAPEIAEGSVGLSFPSYTWEGQQWAWPIDAATQVQAIRPDLLDAPAEDWDQVVALARDGHVTIPLRSPHALMCFLSLSANLGHPCRTDGPGRFVDADAGREALERLCEVAPHLDPECYGMDPIAVYDGMGAGGGIACAPLAYGYVSYSVPGFRPHRLSFHDIPSARPGGGVGGSTLGGTGLAISAFSDHPEEAVAFARRVAGPDAQKGRYVSAGGQAGHRAAWTDAQVDRAAGRFYSATLRTLDGAVLRPRHDGYMPFQDAASQRISQAMKDGDTGGALHDIERFFAATFD